MSNNQITEALRAGIDRLFEHRKTLRKAQTLLRIWPHGLVFECRVLANDAEEYREVEHASCREEVPWDQLASFDVQKARAVADRVCAKAHAYLGTKLEAAE